MSSYLNTHYSLLHNYSQLFVFLCVSHASSCFKLKTRTFLPHSVSVRMFPTINSCYFSTHELNRLSNWRTLCSLCGIKSIAKSRYQNQASPCEAGDGPSVTEIGISPSTSVFLHQCHFTKPLYTSSVLVLFSTKGQEDEEWEPRSKGKAFSNTWEYRTQKYFHLLFLISEGNKHYISEVN